MLFSMEWNNDAPKYRHAKELLSFSSSLLPRFPSLVACLIPSPIPFSSLKVYYVSKNLARDVDDKPLLAGAWLRSYSDPHLGAETYRNVESYPCLTRLSATIE